MTSDGSTAGVSTAAAPVPSGVDGLTPTWLSAVLGAAVTGVRAERIALDTGFSSLLYRLHLTGDADVPPTVIAKLPADSEARGAMELLGGYRRELTFYSEVAGRAPLQTPQVYAARQAEDSAEFVLLLEDLHGWDNPDHLAGLSLDRARLAVDALAGLHAWSVQPANSAVLQHFPSISTSVVRDLLVPAFAPGWQTYRDKSGADVPPRVARFAERFAELAPQALTALTERSMLLHGDIRADNMFFDGSRLKVVDFQLAAVGCGAADIAYLVTQGLPADARRGRDEALLRDYLGGLEPGSYRFDDAWRHYRFATAYLMLLPVIILVGFDGLPERSRSLCLELTARAVAAVDETDALEVFE